MTATARSKADAIVLVHSGICDARMWDGFDLPGATPHEMRGFGYNPLPRTGEYSHADDLEEALAGKQVARNTGRRFWNRVSGAPPEWNADFWLSEASGSELRVRTIEMQEHAFRLQSESEAEEPSTSLSTSMPYEPGPSWPWESSTSRTCTRSPSGW